MFVSSRSLYCSARKKQDVLFLPVNLTIKYLDVVSVLIMKHMNVLFIKLLLDRTLLLKCELFVV